MKYTTLNPYPGVGPGLPAEKTDGKKTGKDPSYGMGTTTMNNTHREKTDADDKSNGGSGSPNPLGDFDITKRWARQSTILFFLAGDAPLRPLKHRKQAPG